MDINNISYKPLKWIYSACIFLVLICVIFLIILELKSGLSGEAGKSRMFAFTRFFVWKLNDIT